jgi:hypothetical protein
VVSKSGDWIQRIVDPTIIQKLRSLCNVMQIGQSHSRQKGHQNRYADAMKGRMRSE